MSNRNLPDIIMQCKRNNVLYKQQILKYTAEFLSYSKTLIIMKQVTVFILIAALISSCDTGKQTASSSPGYANEDTLITQSLFNDKAATISEENIQRVLDGSYKLPAQLRVAIVKLESSSQRRNFWYYWNDEQYLKTQQSYLDLFADKFKQSSRVVKTFSVPDVLI